VKQRGENESVATAIGKTEESPTNGSVPIGLNVSARKNANAPSATESAKGKGNESGSGSVTVSVIESAKGNGSGNESGRRSEIGSGRGIETGMMMCHAVAEGVHVVQPAPVQYVAHPCL